MEPSSSCMELLNTSGFNEICARRWQENAAGGQVKPRWRALGIAGGMRDGAEVSSRRAATLPRGVLSSDPIPCTWSSHSPLSLAINDFSQGDAPAC